MERTTAQAEALEYWQDVLKELGANARSFEIKKEFRGKVSVFSQEFNLPILYVEIRNSDWTAGDNRKLLKFTPPDNYTSVYQKGDKFGDYFVPIEEFEEVIIGREDVVAAMLSDQEDIRVSDMSLRDFYAILHNKPVSLKGWVNSLVKSK